MKRPVLAMLIGASVISTNSVLVKFADVGPTIAGFYRMLFGGLMLAVLLLVTTRTWRWSWRQTGWLVWPAAAFAADLWMWHRSINYVGPGVATLLANLQVFLMALAGIVLFRERPGARFFAGLTLAFAGTWLLIGRDWGAFDGDYRLGIYLGLLTAVCYASYMLTLRLAQQRMHVDSPERLLCVTTLISAVMLGVAGAIEGSSFVIPDSQSWIALLVLGLTGQVLGWVLIARAMPNLPASLVGLLLLLQPSLSFVLDVVLLNRATSSWDWVGVAISLAGIFLASSKVKPVAKEECPPEPQ
jgi:drug/metabolite transporter (DMT)-like permease